jgi:tricorn protease
MKPPKKPVATRVDPEGIVARVVRFPLAEARYHQIVGAGGGKVYLLRSGVKGASGRRMYDPGPGRAERQLVQWDFEKRKTQVVNDSVSAFGVSLDRRTLWIRANRQLRVGPAHPDKAQLDELKKTTGRPGRPSGIVDLRRVRVEVDPTAEWRQMLHETARLMVEHHFDAPTGAEVARWLPTFEAQLARVGGRGELSDLLKRFQGSLGTSHAYEMGGDHRRPPAWRPGALGADITWDAAAGAARIQRVVTGEAEDPTRRSPLVGPGAQIVAGTLLRSVAQRALTATVPPGAALAHHGGAEVDLELEEPGRAPRTVTVRALRSDRQVRYRDLVIRRREWVHEQAAGQVGYVHVPNMGPTGFADFHRDYLVECERPALVVDVRFNGGGHVSQLLLEKLARRRVGRVVPRWGIPSSFPAHAVDGPLVALTNAHAGSDGDIFSHLFKRLGLGPLVGTRTWGGTVGVVARHYLVDHSLVTQPEFAHWFDDVGYGLENHGTEPDVEVLLPPEAESEGVDPQLRAAVEHAVLLLQAR